MPRHAGLERYAEPLDRRHAMHLLRRTNFGAHLLEIDALVGLSAEAAVDMIVDAAVNQGLPDPPSWVDEGRPRDAQEQTRYFETNQQRMLAYRADWLRHMFNGGLRERMTLFWHNHFVTHTANYRLAPFAYRYVTTLRTHALGNFKDFVHAIGIDPAMLLYLNGAQNRVQAPNENYARELLELFTMGPFDRQGNENYTQQDLEEIARALSGWYVDSFTLTVLHLAEFFDSEEKTIFGHAGNWGYDDVVDILFKERADKIAGFVCRKLYKEFIYAEPDETFVTALAQVFLESKFEIAPVLRTLFGSAHFHDESVIGVQIKSPVQMLVGLLRETEPYFPRDNDVFVWLHFSTRTLGQHLLNPPNVAGWEGHHSWLNTTTLQARWRLTEALFAEQRFFLIALSESVLASLDEPVHPRAPKSVFTLPVALAEHLIPVPVEMLDIEAPPEDFAGDLDANPIPNEAILRLPNALNLAKIFLGDRPWYEWVLHSSRGPFILRRYLQYLTRLPEFQLT